MSKPKATWVLAVMGAALVAGPSLAPAANQEPGTEYLFLIDDANSYAILDLGGGGAITGFGSLGGWTTLYLDEAALYGPGDVHCVQGRGGAVNTSRMTIWISPGIFGAWIDTGRFRVFDYDIWYRDIDELRLRFDPNWWPDPCDPNTWGDPNDPNTWPGPVPDPNDPNDWDPGKWGDPLQPPMWDDQWNYEGQGPTPDYYGPSPGYHVSDPNDPNYNCGDVDLPDYPDPNIEDPNYLDPPYPAGEDPNIPRFVDLTGGPPSYTGRLNSEPFFFWAFTFLEPGQPPDVAADYDWSDPFRYWDITVDNGVGPNLIMDWEAWINESDPLFRLVVYYHAEGTASIGDGRAPRSLILTVLNDSMGTVIVTPEPNDPNQYPWDFVEMLPSETGPKTTTELYPHNSTVVLDAVPNANKSLKYWKVFDPNFPGDANYATETNDPQLVLTMSTNWEVEAKFKCGSSEMLPPIGMVLMVLALGVVVRRLT